MKTNYVPAMVMLAAGFVDCILSIGRDYSLLEFTRQLLLVLLIFLVIGWIARILLDKAMKFFADKKEEEKIPEAQEETDSSEAEKDTETK